MLLLPALISMVAASTVPGNPMGSRPRSVGDTVIDLTGNSPVKSKTVDVTTISLDSIITDNNTADSKFAPRLHQPCEVKRHRVAR